MPGRTTAFGTRPGDRRGDRLGEGLGEQPGGRTGGSEETTRESGRGRLLVGTSGFAYRSWIGPFYEPGQRADEFLAAYSQRFVTCELNGTFYRRPSPAAVAAWVAATPPGFRFVVKAQREGSVRALTRDPVEAVPWLTDPLAGFGEKLGAVLFRIPGHVTRNDAQLAALLAAWPAGVPLVVEAQDSSWHGEEIVALVRAHGAVLCATDLDDPPAPAAQPPPPVLRAGGPFAYLRLRRATYTPAELDAWAARIAPLLGSGVDVYAFFRHDDEGQAPARALALLDRLGGTPESAGMPAVSPARGSKPGSNHGWNR